MLQATKRSINNSEPTEVESPVELLQYLWVAFRLHLPSVIAATILSIGLSAFYIYITPATFTARATLIIDRTKVQAQLGGMFRDVPVDAVEVDGQMQLIKSDAVALAVVKKLALAGDPEFVGPPAGLPGLLRTLRSKLSVPEAPQPGAGSDMTAAMAVLGRIEVSRGSGNIIEIEAHSLNPERAAQLANAVVESYIEEQLSSRYQTARQAGGWLQDRIQELAHQTSIADEAVAKFKTKKNIVAAGGRLLSEQQLGELNTQLTVSREKTNEMRARLDRILAITNSDFDNQIVGTVAETLNNPIIVKLRSQYLELAAREADWAGRFGRDHQAVVNLTRQLREISAAIADELRRIAETYKSDYEIAKQRQANLEVAVAETAAHFQEATQAQIELRQLESAAETYRTLHRSALQRSTELVQQQSFPGTAARLITRASAPSGKSGPKTAIILLASTAGGMMFGLGIAVMRVSLDRGFRTPSQVEADLQASCLGLIPTLKGSRRKKSSRPAAPRTIVAGANVSWGVVERPLSRFAEAMRSIRSAAGLASQPIKVLGFTSSLPNEGKSTTAAAFALLVAQTGARVVLVDCDLRNPALSRLFAPGGTQGLFEVISGKTPLDEALWTEPATKLSFLPGAMKSPVPDSAEIMASSALHSFFEELRNKFDCVVVDLPPVAPIVDVRSTANLIDAYVFIVEWGRTKRDVVDLALRKAPAVYENLLGVVLNKVDLKKVCRYDGHRSEYYSDRTYARYEDGQV